MKKADLKKMHAKKRTVYNGLVTSIKRALRIFGNESASSPNPQVSKKGLSDTFLSYNELQRINDQLLKMERQKAEAIRLVRERNRCI